MIDDSVCVCVCVCVPQTLKRDSDDADAVTLPVVGTEAGHVYILPADPGQSQYLCRISLKAVPVLLCPAGRFDVEWRYGCIYIYTYPYIYIYIYIEIDRSSVIYISFVSIRTPSQS